MHGKQSLKKQVRQLTRKPQITGTPVVVVAQDQVRVGKWILRENEDGDLEAVHSETGGRVLLAETKSGEE